MFNFVNNRDIEHLRAPKNSTPSISPINTPRKESYGPGERRQPIGADAETLSNHADLATNDDEPVASVANGDEGGDESALAETMDSDLPEGHTMPSEMNGPADETDSGGHGSQDDIPIHR